MIYLPEKRNKASNGHYWDKHRMNFLYIDIFIWDPPDNRQVNSQVKNGQQVQTKTHHRKVEEKHDSMRVFPKLTEEIGFIYSKSS